MWAYLPQAAACASLEPEQNLTMTKSKTSNRTSKSSSGSASNSTATPGTEAAPEDKATKSEPANAPTPSKESELLDVAASSEDEAPAARGSRKQKLEFEGSMSRSEAFAQLDALAKGLEKGKIELQAKGQSVDLSPSHHFDVELKAATKGSKERISIELSWRADSDPEQKLKVIVGSDD